MLGPQTLSSTLEKIGLKVWGPSQVCHPQHDRGPMQGGVAHWYVAQWLCPGTRAQAAGADWGRGRGTTQTRKACLPSLRGEMGKGRMKEVGEWHRFLEVLVSWLALIDEAYVSEMGHCLKHPNVIEQAKLQSPVAARSAKLFYYLGQCLAKWERGLELLRSVSKRQGLSAAGYEVVSRMEAVYVRDECLKLHSRCGHLKKPMDVVRYLEDELSKVESKLINFPELKLSEADKVSLILQAISADARQYVVLHGHSNDWSSVSTTLKFYEEQLRMCELPGSSSSRALSEIICDHCGKKGHKKENCWQRKREERENAKEGGKTRPSRDGGKDHGKGKGKDDKGKSKGKGKDKGKGKGKDKSKKKKKGARARSASSDGSSASSSGDEGRAAAMALRASGDVRDLSFCLPETEDPERSHVSLYRSRYCFGTLGSSSGQLDVDRVCSVQNVEPRDVWLVDSGATCHIVSSLHLSSFRVLKRRNRTVTLLNASGGEIVVHEVVDIEVHFDKLRLRLEDVLVADVTFNVLSPWSAAEKGWRTHLYRTGSRMFRGKRNLKLEGVNRAWWALSGSKKSTSKRQPSGGKDMELDSVAGKQPVRGPSPPPGILRKSPEDQEARSSSGTPRSLETTRSSEMSSRHVLEGSPFAFLVRSMRIAPCRGREYDSKEVLYDGEVETCVVDPGSDVGSLKFRAACFEEAKHVVHGCALRDLGRMCMDVREAQTCDATLEQVSKSRQTHEHCVAEDVVLKPGSEAVRDASLELERYVEGSCTAKLSFVPPGHRRAGCGLIDVLTSVMLLAKAQLCIAVSELFSAAVMILVSCSCAWTGEILSCRRMERALIGLRIPFWLKIAVVFATALCIRAEGVQPCCPAVGLKAEGIQPGCVAIGIRSEEAKPLSSDYVCSLSSYCCRDGSFEDSGYGSAACSQPNYVQDDEQSRYKGVPAPIRRCHVRLFGVAGCETSIVNSCSNLKTLCGIAVWATYTIARGCSPIEIHALPSSWSIVTGETHRSTDMGVYRSR